MFTHSPHTHPQTCTQTKKRMCVSPSPSSLSLLPPPFPSHHHQLQTTLEQYISGEEEAVHQGGYTALQGASDLQAMFAPKRRTGRKGHGHLSFRFDSSRHAISINSYMKEQRDLELAEVRVRAWAGLAQFGGCHGNRPPFPRRVW